MNRAIFILVLAISLSAGAQQILVRPYLQPGNSPSLTREHKVLIWQTDTIPGLFTVEYAVGPMDSMARIFTAKVTSVELNLPGAPSILYRAIMNLDFDNILIYNESCCIVREHWLPMDMKRVVDAIPSCIKWASYRLKAVAWCPTAQNSQPPPTQHT